MVKECCVTGCDGGSEKDMKLFRIPKNRVIRRQWVSVINASRVTLNSLVCRRHFKQEDFNMEGGREKLRPKVVPSVFEKPKKPPPKAVPRKKETKRRRRRTRRHVSESSSDTPDEDEDDDYDDNDEDIDDDERVRQIEEDIRYMEAMESVLVEFSPSSYSDESHKEPQSPASDTERLQVDVAPPSPQSDPEKVNGDAVDKSTGSTHSNRLTELNKTDLEDILTNFYIPTLDKKDIHQPTIDKPTIDKPSIDKPAIDKPAIDKTAIDKPVIEPSEGTSLSNGSSNDNKEQEPPDKEVEKSKSEEEKTESIDKREVREGSQEVEYVADGETIDIDSIKDPKFIEISVDKGKQASDDCLMVMEDLQVELDPAALMLPEPSFHDAGSIHDDEDDDDEKDKRPADPISLLTSSDDDDVIIQEPHIDTVEVSDATDEDDMPLTRLVKVKKHKAKKSNKAEDNLGKILWGLYEYYCIECKFTTTCKSEYKKHKRDHSTVLLVCDTCRYTTSSQVQFDRHKKKHKDEKRFKCDLCDYKAKHRMSIVYHMKSHSQSGSVARYSCKKCAFKTNMESRLEKHKKLCVGKRKRHICDFCDYETDRKTDMTRHRLRRHGESDLLDFDPNWVEC